MTTSSPRRPALVSLRAAIAVALAEDLGEDPAVDADVTAAATVPASTTADGAFVPRESGVIAGLEAIVETYRQLDPEVEVALHAADGDPAVSGAAVAEVSGPARAVLAGERTALNLLTHLSGIATATRVLVDAVAGTGCVVRDTRKTLPGLRLLEKQAVLAGGGRNHRMGLVDALLVKDNHVAAAGGVADAVLGALHHAGGLPVQVEVDSLAQLDVVLATGARAVLLDNFSLADIAEGVRRCRELTAETGEEVFVEASGGITLEEVAQVAAAGVDAVAVGALTHSSGALDIGLDMRIGQRSHVPSDTGGGA